MIHLRRPLVAAFLAFLAGLLSTLRFPLPLRSATLAFAAIALVSLLHGSFGSGKSSAYRWRLLLLLFIASGAVAGSATRIEVAGDCRALFQDDARLRATGKLGAAYRVPADGWSVPLVPLLDPTIAGFPGCGDEIRVRLPPDLPFLPPGSALEVSGHWRTFATPVARSPWPRDPRFLGFIRVDSVVVSDSTSAAGGLWLHLRARADARLAALFPRDLEMIEALVLGRREYVAPEVRDRYSRAGLSHLLAISGMHVGLIAAVLLLLGSAARLPRRQAIALTLAATWAYLAVIGAGPSAIRAGIMISLGLAAVLLQRPSAAPPIVAAAAFAILAREPLAILDPGFQLSFAGVLGIILLRPLLLRLIPERLRRRARLRTAIDAFVMGVAAFIVTAPIAADHFGIIAPISILAGVPAVPVMSLALTGAMAALVLDPLAHPLARLLADGSALALHLLDGIARVAGAIPFGHADVPPPPWWMWIVAAASGVALHHLLTGAPRRFRWIVGSGVSLAVIVFWPLVVVGGSDGLAIHFIDVGQGDAIAIRTPGEHWVLVDTGPASDDFDAGQRRVLPFLRARGASHLEALVLTHPDQDHIGGAPAVLQGIPVDYLFEPGLAAGKGTYLRLLDASYAGGTQWRAARAGRTMDLDGVHFQFLWPDAAPVDAFVESNQISAVIMVTYGDFSLLLTGDAGVDVEAHLVRRSGGDLHADILKLGHHGSDTSTSEEFLSAVDPELAVVSAGRRNRYGHPSPEVMARVERHSIPVARTDREGTISIDVPPGGRTWRREAW